jgi:Ca-activated chloride channel family protein
VEVVNLNLSVTDPKDRFVIDLGEQDLAVFEDGVRQDICLFTREKLPISLAILIDGSASMQASLPVAQAAAIRLVRTLGPQDQAEIVQFDRRFTVLQDFTSDHGALEAAIGRIQAQGETALYNALYIALKDLSVRKKEGELRRRALVVLSDGEDTASTLTDDQVLAMARRTEVAVYAIGLFHPAPGVETGTGLPTFFLTGLARETGGRAYFPSNLAQLEGVYDRIAEELRTLYGVGYVSNNPRKDGGWRRIVIQTSRGNLLVRHKLGYFAR